MKNIRRRSLSTAFSISRNIPVVPEKEERKLSLSLLFWYVRICYNPSR